MSRDFVSLKTLKYQVYKKKSNIYDIFIHKYYVLLIYYIPQKTYHIFLEKKNIYTCSRKKYEF